METRKAGARKNSLRTVRRGAAASSNRLQAYRGKRDFGLTPEPAGGQAKKPGSTLVYIIQRHLASHLHYDLRLEEAGVLKSWAIPKTPPEAPGEKRLAVETEDHPLEYASFEGSIPEGEYGAGTVAAWDRGTYDPLETTAAKRIIRLHGRKLKGVYALIKLPVRKGEKGKNWLFFKTGPSPNPRTKPRTP